jgi:hypothetical protein
MDYALVIRSHNQAQNLTPRRTGGLIGGLKWPTVAPALLRIGHRNRAIRSLDREMAIHHHPSGVGCHLSGAPGGAPGRI